jgi:uncharacterized membrane protein affecting hemolysin expression
MKIDIPHGEHIRFVSKVLKFAENEIEVECKFDKKPTIAILVEASAQSAAAYMQRKSDREDLLGFLIKIRNFKYFDVGAEPIDIVRVNVIVKNLLDNIYVSSVKIYKLNDKVIAEGELLFLLGNDLKEFM